MLKVAADENLKRQIVSGLRRRLPSLDLMTVQSVGLAGASDPEILAWAAAERRVLVTHDTRTMKDFAYRRVADGEPMPGVVTIPDRTPITQAIEDLMTIIQVATADEMRDRVLRLPL